MKPLRTIACLLLASAGSPAVGDSYSLTIVTQSGVGITSPQEWSRRLAESDIVNVRIRGARDREQPGVEEIDTGRTKVYRVTAVLTSHDTLLLPGETFTQRETAKLSDYLERLLADGAQAMTAPRGQFGLTKEEFESTFTAVGQPITFVTKGEELATLIAHVGQQTNMKLTIADGLAPTLERLRCRDDLRTLSLGCGLAIALKADGLAVAPEKPRGEPVRLAVRFATDMQEQWPIGWPSKSSPSELAPALFQKINVEIDGFTLQEAMDAVGPRLGMPVLWDHAALAARRIDPTTKQVKLERARLYYSRILDKLLFQARLHGEVRIDEAGTVFYWITQ